MSLAEELRSDVRLAQGDARRARDAALETHENVGTMVRELASFRKAVNVGFANLDGKVDALILDVRELRAMRPRLESLAEIDLADLSEDQKARHRRQRFIAASRKLARRCAVAAVLSGAGFLGLISAYLLLAYVFHVRIPLELLR